MPTKSNPHRKEYRSRLWREGQERKALRVAEQKEREQANRAAGKAPKARKRKRDNMRLCNRCHTRTIVAGSVCWCKDLTGRPAR